MKKWKELVLEFLPIVGCALLPLFFSLSYQINLYLTWEGAYRLYSGEIPFKDFGIPMGFCFWLIPAFFFKIFGPTLFTLAKAQAFINILSGISFRWILVNVTASFHTRFLSILVFSLTFILGLYWPQYNHSVIVFQLVALGFLFQYFKESSWRYQWLFLVASCFFLTFTFFTKQDGGGLSILIGGILILVYSYKIKDFKPVMISALSMIIFFSIAIIPFLKYDFSYWFNYGQEPHYARISMRDILTILLEESRWEKFYLALILGIYFIRRHKSTIEVSELLLTLLVIGILVEAMIFQVTSYVPKDNNIFFHAFACSYIFYQVQKLEVFNIQFVFTVFIFIISIWWSEKYWKYADRIVSKVMPTQINKSVVSINTYILEPEACDYYVDLSTWQESPVHSFRHVKMPASTVSGIDRFLQLRNQSKKISKVLNMSELTPLAKEFPFSTEQGPLWYHLGVGMFDRELNEYIQRIEQDYYDIVIFENIPLLNNFYPFKIREHLKTHYRLIDSFEAPRIVYPGTIEVYSRID
ncbi:MAG: hypothetical protein JNM78_14035 [Cyclobacteriaceae bacterium]|nr:hypothetical protein [Cyclobacteriaceae bacterium]